jgi:hypothetical protein
LWSQCSLLLQTKKWEIQGWSNYNDMTFITSLTDTSQWKKEKVSLSTPWRHICRGSRGIAPLILNLNTRWRWVVKFIPGKENPVPFEVGGWVGPGASLDNFGEEEISCPC